MTFEFEGATYHLKKRRQGGYDILRPDVFVNWLGDDPRYSVGLAQRQAANAARQARLLRAAMEALGES